MEELTTEQLKKIMANPFYCINIHPIMCEKHEVMIDKETWKKCANRFIHEEGIDEFLDNLLDNLEWNFRVKFYNLTK